MILEYVLIFPVYKPLRLDLGNIFHQISIGELLYYKGSYFTTKI